MRQGRCSSAVRKGCRDVACLPEADEQLAEIDTVLVILKFEEQLLALAVQRSRLAKVKQGQVCRERLAFVSPWHLELGWYLLGPRT
jgi:hypothetical protein